MPTHDAITVLGVHSITAAVTVSNTATETALASKALPSGMLNIAGRSLHVRAWGEWSADASPPATWILRLKYGSTAVWQYTATPSAGPYTDEWRFEADVVTVSSGNVRCYGEFLDTNGGAVSVIVPSDLAVATTPTTSGAVTVSLTLEWASADAGSSFTCELATFEVGGLT